MSQAYQKTALEITAESMWNPEKVNAALGCVEENGLDALIFHEADMLNKFIFPSNWLPEESWWRGKTRRGIWAVVNTRAYLRDVLQKCLARGVEFYLQLKELGYPDEFLEDAPGLVVDGVVCPTHPDWPKLLERRYTEALELLPGLSGIIISVGTLEGRSSLTARRCSCDRCATTDDMEWHRGIVGAIHAVTKRYGVRLIVREFSYNAQDQGALVASLDQLPSDIEYAVKPYARDFYLTWPDNPALTAARGRTKWLEYDCHGQFFGWGVFPLSVVPDQAARLQRGADAGCSIVQLRVDWERINGLWAVESFARVNVATGATIARDPDIDHVQALAGALRSCGVITATLSDADAQALAALWLELYPIALRILYVKGNVYNSCSMIPKGIKQGWFYMHNLHNLPGWEGESIGSLDVSDPGVVADIITEKTEAYQDYLQWHERMKDWDDSGVLQIPDPCHVGDVLDWSLLYVQAWVASAQVVILVKAAQARELSATEVTTLRVVTDDLDQLHATVARRYARGAQSHHARLLIDPDHLESMVADARTILAEQDTSV